ncbi:MAG: HAD-IIIC family phosphatase, partial [Porcipelethomonas sp.]
MQIKLIIWDLDETFWKGTLSDGEVSEIPDNTALVKSLTDRGIINSICSKNDFEKVKNKLVEMNIWDYFVFPSIDWTNKGERVKNIISDMNLRPVNCLFVDDNVNNLEEAKFVLPELQTATPEQLALLKDSDDLKGKDDLEHSRLKQYKILETQTAARRESGSNEEFLWASNIHVRLVEDCSDQLVRIYEMIHRNNQLNYTKDRISQEEVNAVFTDKNIRSGYVKVQDKYGDHGIIGCYAVKDNLAIQFVFSCRILGMGVEQWVYSELGYPQINVVGDVAVDLKNDFRPGWINNENNSENVKTGDIQSSQKLLVYGSCPLRPIWAYLQPKLPNAEFAEIDPTPSVCNIAVLLRENDDTIRYLLDNVSVFDSNYTFDKRIKNGEIDYLLITLTNEDNVWKYESKSTKKCFYVYSKLNGTNAKAEVLNDYVGRKINQDDIFSELDFICKTLPRRTKLFVTNISEVMFSRKGPDENYRYRIESNRRLDELSKKYSNLTIIDLKKYACNESDFFEQVANHYNRAIGYKVSQDILKEIGVKSENDSTADSKKHSILKCGLKRKKYTIGSEEINVEFFLTNGTLYLDIQNKNNRFSYDVQLFRNRFCIAEFNVGTEGKTKFNIDKPGVYFFGITPMENDTEYNIIWTEKISYSDINYFNYVDVNNEDFEIYKASLNHFINDNTSKRSRTQDVIRVICDLAATGINISD